MDTPTTERFEHVMIVGVGLLGASLGLALKEKQLAERVTGVGRAGSDSLRIALQRGAIDAIGDLSAAATADLVVLCTPVRQFQKMLEELAPLLQHNAIVTDVGSTKQQVMKWAVQAMPVRRYFVGSHPMAGSEKRGPDFARADLYQNALCIICSQPDYQQDVAYQLEPDTHTARMYQAVQQVERLWQAVGMRTLRAPADLHDRWVASISHLPHAAAASLVLTAAEDPDALQAAANGFIDTTRIASGDVEMWTDILLTNQEAVADRLAAFERQLAKLRAAVTAGDEGAIRAHLEKAKAVRDAFIRRRGQ